MKRLKLIQKVQIAGRTFQNIVERNMRFEEALNAALREVRPDIQHYDELSQSAIDDILRTVSERCEAYGITDF